MNPIFPKFFIVACLSVCFSFSSFAVNKSMKQNPKEPTAEERAQMATMHEKVALCLRSSKTIAECHDEMKKNCTMGDRCMMGMGMGKKRGPMMDKEWAMPHDGKSEPK
jgi:hypothetical protein